VNRNPSIKQKWQLCSVALSLCAGLCWSGVPLWAEAGILVVTVKDVHNRPVAGLKIGVSGDGGSAITDDNGKARIPLASQNKPNDSVSLQVQQSPPGKNLVMVSPWDSRILVPSFENKSENFVLIIVAESGDRAALENGSFLAALTAKIAKANTLKGVDRDGRQEDDSKTNLGAVAKQYGLDPQELDKAIRAWGQKTTDPYEAGLAALYEKHYPAASTQLQESLRIREAKLATDQSAVADAAFFLGQALYQEGKYKESATAFQKCLQLRPDNVFVLEGLGISLMRAGDYRDGEQSLSRGLAIRLNTLDPNDPAIGNTLSNFAGLLEDTGDYGRAEQMLNQARAIYEKSTGFDSPDFAACVSNLASLFQIRRDYVRAEPLFRQALEIDQKALGLDSTRVATDLNNLGLLLQDKGDYARAEPLFRQALEIDEKTLGPDHPDLAVDLNNLGELLQAKGNYGEAKQLLSQSLSIRKTSLGPNHPDVAQSLNNLAELLKSEGNYASAAELLQQALTIKQKALLPNNPSFATSLSNLAGVFQAQHDYARAEPLFRQALEIDEKAFGPDTPDVAVDAITLGSLLDVEKNYGEAEQLIRRSLTIMEKTFGRDDPRTERVRRMLNALVTKESDKLSEK
jgi:tetratricopeptide (TPR) repeat protein